MTGSGALGNAFAICGGFLGFRRTHFLLSSAQYSATIPAARVRGKKNNKKPEIIIYNIIYCVDPKCVRACERNWLDYYMCVGRATSIVADMRIGTGMTTTTTGRQLGAIWPSFYNKYPILILLSCLCFALCVRIFLSNKMLHKKKIQFFFPLQVVIP